MMLHRLLNGPQTLGKTRTFWLLAIALILLAFVYPLFADAYDVGNMAYLLLWVFMAMGLCLVWGYGGMMSFGQTIFFGIAGYGYGVFAINLGGGGLTTICSLVLALVLAGIVAAVLGYFLIWGNVTGVFFGIVTLSVTLVLAFFLGQTAGPEWHIGEARLNGFNGMKDMSALGISFGGEMHFLDGVSLYYAVLVLLVATYLGLRMLLNSRFGNVVVALRENPQRAELLGYDVRKYQLGIFIIGAMLSGLSGVLYTSWGQFITPASVGLPAASMPVVWVAFSGRADLTATTVGSFALLWVFQFLTVYSQQLALLLMGMLLLGTVMLAPQGFVIGICQGASRLITKRQSVTARS
jgi:branched-chain amino acid transport system permease protein